MPAIRKYAGLGLEHPFMATSTMFELERRGRTREGLAVPRLRERKKHTMMSLHLTCGHTARFLVVAVGIEPDLQFNPS